MFEKVVSRANASLMAEEIQKLADIIDDSTTQQTNENIRALFESISNRYRELALELYAFIAWLDNPNA